MKCVWMTTLRSLVLLGVLLFSSVLQQPVRAASPPVVTGVSPVSGPPAGGTVVTVTGSGFTGVTEVSFGGNPGSTVILLSDTRLTVVAPGGTSVVDVTVTGPDGTSAITAADRYAYGTALVTGVSPVSGPSGGG